jgi:uncharacterized membrane protein
METAEQSPAFPAHVGDALRAIVDMQTAHDEQASPMARIVDRITAMVARPDFLIYVGGAVILWIGANVLLGLVGLPMPDSPPFPLLELLASCAALFSSQCSFWRVKDGPTGWRTFANR